MLNIVGLNPSTADALKNDPTIRRCIGFARDNGYGSLFVTNLFAYRATHPRDLFAATDPVGPDNDPWLKEISGRSDTLLLAWGNHGQFRERDQMVSDLLQNGFCLGINQTGTPKHPLYVKKDQAFLPYPPR